MFTVICCLPASLLYTVMIAPLQQITLPCYKYKESQRETAQEFELVLSTPSDWFLIQWENDKVLAGLYFPWLDTDRPLSECFLVIRHEDVGLDFNFWKILGLMWVGPSAELRCPEEEGPFRSTPSAVHHWRGGWGQVRGHQTLPEADWEGLRHHCQCQRAGCHPENTGARITDQNIRQSKQDKFSLARQVCVRGSTQKQLYLHILDKNYMLVMNLHFLF